jgi:hypothetical protein
MGLTCSLGQNIGLSDCDSITEIIILKKSHSDDVQILFMLCLSKVKSQVQLGLQETEGTKCILWSTLNKEFKSYHLQTSVSDIPNQMNHGVTIWDNISVKLNMCYKCTSVSTESGSPFALWLYMLKNAGKNGYQSL